MFYTVGQQQVAITGDGTIDGNAEEFHSWHPERRRMWRNSDTAITGRCVFFVACRDVRLRDITIHHQEQMLVPRALERVVIANCSVSCHSAAVRIGWTGDYAIRDVAVDWEESHVLNGEVGEYVTFARKARGTEEWFLGSAGGEQAHDLRVELSFLDPARRYRAEIYRDGDRAHWKTAPFDFVRETREVASTDTLPVHLAAGGGQAIRFVPMDSPVR